MNWQENAAQLWCKPENARTEFDSTLCGTIAEALEEAYKQGYKDADKAIACEYRDPNGTIWEWCEKVQKKNESLKALVDSVQEGLEDGIGFFNNCKEGVPDFKMKNEMVERMCQALAKIAEFKENKTP